MMVKDSGSRQSFESGAVRDIQAGKGRFDLIPWEGMERLAKHFEAGAAKYGDRNWEKGIPASRYMDSMLRHAHKAAAGMDDEDHLAAVAWNAMCAIATIERRPDLDDRPKPEACKLYENAAVECDACPPGSCEKAPVLEKAKVQIPLEWEDAYKLNTYGSKVQAQAHCLGREMEWKDIDAPWGPEWFKTRFNGGWKFRILK